MAERPQIQPAEGLPYVVIGLRAGEVDVAYGPYAHREDAEAFVRYTSTEESDQHRYVMLRVLHPISWHREYQPRP